MLGKSCNRDTHESIHERKTEADGAVEGGGEEAHDERCGELDYLMTDRSFSSEYVMTNNFAFGGINTSLIFKRWNG